MDDAFLDLLRSEAPIEAFDEPLRRAVEEGADRATQQRIARAQRVALSVRDTIEGYQRRERELAALYETAGDLTSLRDVGRVLQAIGRRARQLIGTDVAYLTLIDEGEGDTYMRVTEGIVTSDFPHLRLPLGTGLGGLVAATADPYYTANYAEDDRFAHASDIDGAVAEEGLVAILGVPLMIGDVVIGVLFAANRRERPFAQEEVALLGSLAAHAAIAIENARLFQETRQALADLDRATEDLRAHTDAVERASAAHERLTQVALHGGDIDDVAAVVVDLLGGRLRVVGPDGRDLAAPMATDVAGSAGPAAPPPDDAGDGGLAGILRGALAEGVTRSVSGPDGGDTVWVSPIVAGSERLGALVLSGLARVDDADLRTLERAALVSALVLLHDRSLAEAEQRARGELLGDLLDGRVDDVTRFRRRARLVGLDPDRDAVVVVGLVDELERRRAVLAAADLVRERAGFAGEHRGHVVVLLPGDDTTAATRLLWERLTDVCQQPVTVGGAGPAQGVEALVGANVEARRCVRALVALGRTGTCATTAELGAYALVLGQAPAAGVDAFVETVVGPVLAYDADRGTGLRQTLETYFDAGGNVARTARQLHIHVNTLYQRLERVDGLLGSSWRSGDPALQLQLALRLHRLASGGVLDEGVEARHM